MDAYHQQLIEKLTDAESLYEVMTKADAPFSGIENCGYVANAICQELAGDKLIGGEELKVGGLDGFLGKLNASSGRLLLRFASQAHTYVFLTDLRNVAAKDDPIRGLIYQGNMDQNLKGHFSIVEWLAEDNKNFWIDAASKQFKVLSLADHLAAFFAAQAEKTKRLEFYNTYWVPSTMRMGANAELVAAEAWSSALKVNWVLLKA